LNGQNAAQATTETPTMKVLKNDNIYTRSNPLNFKPLSEVESRELSLHLAMRDAKLRGLPEGWICVYGVSPMMLANYFLEMNSLPHMCSLRSQQTVKSGVLHPPTVESLIHYLKLYDTQSNVAKG
jgi:hypothetical protein